MEPYYERDGVAIYHADSREVLAELETGCADLVLTDPPYGMSYESTTGATIRCDGGAQAFRLWRGCLVDLDRVLRSPAHTYVFCHWESLPDFYDAIVPFWRVKNALVWDKRNYGPGDVKGDYAHDYELVLFAHKGRRELNDGRDLSVRHVPIVNHRARIHPTQKPVELLAYYIRKSTEPGELVIDPFTGSGATLRAALATGRRAIGIEVDERFCERAAEQLEALEVGDAAAIAAV